MAQEDIELRIREDVEDDEPFPIKKGPPLYQLRAIFRKNATLLYRSKGTCCCQLSIPIIAILLVGSLNVLFKELTKDDESFNSNVVNYNSPSFPFYFFSGQSLPYILFTELDQEGGSGSVGEMPFQTCSSEDPFPQPTYDSIFGSFDRFCYDNGYLSPWTERKNSKEEIDESILKFKRFYQKLPTRERDNFRATLENSQAMNAIIFQKSVLNQSESGRLALEYDVMVDKLEYQDTLGDIFLFMGVVFQITKAFTRISVYQNMTISPYIVQFPEVSPGFDFGSLLTIFLFPFAFSFLLPVYVYDIVHGKQERLREMMKMMGMRMTQYWIITYLFDLFIYLVLMVFVFAVGAAFSLDFFLQTNFAIIIALFIGWGFAQTSLGFFLSTFFSKSRTATILCYFLVLVQIIVALVVNSTAGNTASHIGFKLFPPWAFYRGIFLIGNACGLRVCLQKIDEDLGQCIGALWIGAVVYLILALYLDQVLPQQYGVRKQPLFFISKFIKLFRKKRQPIHDPLLDEEQKFEDEDVKKEREFVLKGNLKSRDFPIICRNLSKTYKSLGRSRKFALKSLYLSMKQGQCFGLLGPNGAGKCLDPFTPIAMYDGSIKLAKDIVSNDLLLGDDSKPRRVLSICTGEENMFQIIPKNGEAFIVNEPHILTLRCPYSPQLIKKGPIIRVEWFDKDGFYVRDFKHKKEAQSFSFSLKDKCDVIDIALNEFLTKEKRWRENCQLYRVAFDWPHSDVQFDPYVYGLWLAKNQTQKINYEPEILMELQELLKTNAYQCFSSNSIHKNYLANSRSVRLQLLAGLIDMCGEVVCNHYQFIIRPQEMAESIGYLVRSLGYLCKIQEVRDETKFYNISFYGRIEEIPVRITRKKFITRISNRTTQNVTTFSVQAIGKGPYCGFTLDGNGRFLLGDFTVTHNTTTISILTGLFPPTEGTAIVCGYDIRTDMDCIHTMMGVCPQFDTLWEQLTTEDTLIFYTQLKGIFGKECKDNVTRSLESVGLLDARHKKVKELSGGMKRRLSVAVSLIGSPAVIFLDEPTTGLDPASRRQLWDVLLKVKEGKCMILTTHSMEEADILCDRIGIVSQGRLKVVGQNIELKNKYGAGYSLKINFKVKDTERVESFMQTNFPHAVLTENFPGNYAYQIPRTEVVMSQIIQQMNSKKEESGIIDWGISQTSLEDVFLNIVRREEGEK